MTPLNTNLLRQIQVRLRCNKHAWNVIQRVLLLDRLLPGQLRYRRSLCTLLTLMLAIYENELASLES
jgi:hypothetical protein